LYTVVVICLFVQIVIITADYQTFLQIVAAVMYSMALLGMNTYIYAPKDDLKPAFTGETCTVLMKQVLPVSIILAITLSFIFVQCWP